MAGKQRGRSRGRGNRGRGIDRGSGRGGGSGRGRGRGGQQVYVAIHEDDGDVAVDTMDFHPKDRCNIHKEHRRKVTSFDSDSNPGHRTPVQGTSSVRENRYGHGRWGGRISPDSLGLKERAGMHQVESKLRHSKAPLSQLLYEDRPLLKPITFIRSKHTPSLFLKEEEIFKPVAEEAGELKASHVPTADRLFRIFHRGGVGPNLSQSPSDAEELLEIDFTDFGRVMDRVEGLVDVAVSSEKTTSTKFEKADNETMTTVGEKFTRLCINSKPSSVQDSLTPANHIPFEHPETRVQSEDIDEDDEIIVYVAPHPRNGKLGSNPIQTSSAAAATFIPSENSGQASSSYQGTHDSPDITASSSEPVLEHTLAPSPSPPPSSPPLKPKDASSSVLPGPFQSAHRARRPRRISRRRMRRHATFGSFGAIRAEAALHEVDPWRDEQRRGDSDVDWGGSTSEESAEDGGMLVDQEIDVCAMEAFVRDMSTSGTAHVSSDDLRDEARTRIEAEDKEKNNEESGVGSNGSADEDDTELELASDMQDMLIPAEEGEVALGGAPLEDEDESTSDEEVTPKASFQARLERLRKQTDGRPIKDILEDELDQELEVSEDDSVFAISKIQDLLDENDEILRAPDCKQRNRIFQAIHHGKFQVEVDLADSPARRRKEKFIPEELHDQWERDRKKKAERKRLRELERIAAAIDPFTAKRGGKKMRKARLAAALAESVTLEMVVGYMRQFVTDAGGGNTLRLPPMGRDMRKSVHELALAFRLKSKSQGNGPARFTTLMKTTLCDTQVDEKAIARISRKSSSSSSYVVHGSGKGKGRAHRIRPRDGEVVGEAAPKLDGSNIGFRMLSAMGWEEGGRIGVTGGLEAPLVAVIKTTKLGLGAKG